MKPESCLRGSSLLGIYLTLFAVGAGVRALTVMRPIDRASWRECDIAGISRNYFREGMNLFYPRIDWRGNGPGFAEMEFPIYPWTIAWCYRLLGEHELIGRWLSYGFSLSALGIFFRLARRLLPASGALAACLFFSLSRIPVAIANSLQPDGLMFLCILAAVSSFLLWSETGAWKHYATATLFTAAAILAKAPAAHIGLLYAFILLHKQGLKWLGDWRLWLFAVLTLMPAALWYVHANRFWRIYGNSLGVSNEYHWAGWDLVTTPYFLLGIVKQEWWRVFTAPGAVVAAAGVWFRWKQREVTFSLLWLAAAGIYYLVAARTTAESWASYYHVASVPPAALLFGAGAAAVFRSWKREFTPSAVLACSAVLVALLLAYSLTSTVPGSTQRWLLAGVLLAGALALSHRIWIEAQQSSKSPPIQPANRPFLRRAMVLLALLCFAPALLFESRSIVQDALDESGRELYRSALQFEGLIPEHALIVASGGPCTVRGYPVAYNASYFFYWLDRKGFNICEQDQSIASLQALERDGAQYFIAEKQALDKVPGFQERLYRTYQLMKETEVADLFRLAPGDSFHR
jgi:4-amino-4-deoxy-L-arabinose transferase-like glycosyltransferase